MHKYDNQDVLDEENRKLKQIDPTLVIRSWLPEENRICAIRVILPVKGNMKKIQQLEEDGWIKRGRTRRFVRRSGEGISIMMQHMEKIGGG